MIVTFEGGSDDIVTVGIGKALAKLSLDEHYVDGHGRRGFRVQTPGGTRDVSVVVIYGIVGATWHVAYGQLDEGHKIPPWAFTTSIAHAYSMRLVIDTIDDLVELIPEGPE
jgi:hypothetical protein